MASPSAFPVLHSVTSLGGRVSHSQPRKKPSSFVRDADDASLVRADTLHNNSTTSIYDVKFYPYSLPDDDSIFAVVVARDVYVFRPLPDPRDPVEILRVFRDPKPDASLNSLVWSQDIETGDPLLCFGGAGSGNIKIFNVFKAEYQRSLSGHGGAVNDLAVSPVSPTILASASADFSIRLWNLDPKFAKQPCAAILASPDAHKQPVLALAFHSDGKYLLSGGTDTMINLWPVPDVPDVNAGTDKATRVYFPLFSSTEVHSDYVDCLRFHGDLILSHAASTGSEDLKAKKNSILLWKIDGFSSADPVPDKPPVAQPGVWTRSAFGGRFQRLLTFDMPNTAPFYMRFSLFDMPGFHPILVMGNEKSRFSFWDLYALETGGEESSVVDVPKKRKRRGGYRPRGSGRASMGHPKSAAQHGGDDHDEGENYETGIDDNDNESDSDGVEDDNDTPTVDGGGGTMGTPSMSDRRPPTAGVASSRPQTQPTANEQKKPRGKSMQQKAKESRFDISDPFRPIAPHYTLTVPKYNFTVRQVAWSNCGKWCVAVGEVGLVCIFRRWVDTKAKKGGVGANVAGDVDPVGAGGGATSTPVEDGAGDGRNATGISATPAGDGDVVRAEEGDEDAHMTGR